MDGDTAARFIASLTKSLQAVIHGCLDFESDIEVGGYVYLRVDSAQRVDYVLSEKMQKSDTNSLTFHSNSFHALPQQEISKHTRDRSDSSLNASGSSGKSLDCGRRSRTDAESQMLHSTSMSKVSHQSSDHGSRRNSIGLGQSGGGGGGEAEFHTATSGARLSSSNRSSAVTPPDVSRSRDRTQSLTDFQTAFRNPSASLANQPQQSSTGNWGVVPNGSNSRLSSSQQLHHHQQQQQQQSKAGILPDAGDMEVVHIKTEDEEEVFSIPIPSQQAASETGEEAKHNVFLSFVALHITIGKFYVCVDYMCGFWLGSNAVRGRGRERERENSNSNSLLYQTPGVYVQGGSNKQFNSSSDISFGKSLSKVYTGGGEQQSKGQS